jgi:hypothetical protein
LNRREDAERGEKWGKGGKVESNRNQRGENQAERIKRTEKRTRRAKKDPETQRPKAENKVEAECGGERK